jgi:dephospho-CoA kinase
MKKVALTGGIATGKSYVLERFRNLGVAIIDADRLAREVVRRGTPGSAAVVRRFGAEYLGPDGDIDRRRLANLVFGDPDARRDLEAIVHPLVYEGIASWFAAAAARGEALAVADIPLLYETGREGDFDCVIVTACSPARQLERLMARDGCSEEAARRRIAAQWPVEVKARRADFVITTDGSFADTDRQVEAIYERLVIS